MLTTKRPPKRTRQEACAALVASSQRPIGRATMATPASLGARPAAVAPAPKLPRAQRTDQAIRDSARDEECHVRLPAVCNGRRDTTVWSHWPGLDGDRGMGIKALDLCGAYTCAACHDAIDGRAQTPHTRTAIEREWMRGHLRSLVTLARKGLI